MVGDGQACGYINGTSVACQTGLLCAARYDSAGNYTGSFCRPPTVTVAPPNGYCTDPGYFGDQIICPGSQTCTNCRYVSESGYFCYCQ